MRTFLKWSLCFAGLCSIACKPDEPSPGPEPVVEFQTITLTAGQTGTKSYLGTPEGGTLPILWDATDELWVRSAAQSEGSPGSRFTTSASALVNGGLVAQFVGETLNKGPYIAVYPYSLVADGSDNSKVIIKVPQDQSYLKNSFGKGANISACVWESGTRINFTSLAGTVKLNLTGYSGVKRVVVADNDPSFALWGDCIVTPGEKAVESVSWKNDSEKRNEIILDCGNAVQLNLTAPESFYLVVPAGAFAKGLTVTMYGINNEELDKIEKNEACTVGVNTVVPVNGAQPVFAGDGTESSPYLISKPSELVLLSELCKGTSSGSFNGKFYKQSADINMDGLTLSCIGITSDKAFKGVYDGGGFTIKNLAPVPGSGKAAGLFGYLDGATVKNLKIDEYINAGTAGEEGVIAGRASNSTFSDIEINASVRFAKCACGGVVGYLNGGTISNCKFNGFIHDEEYADFQGITVVSCVGGIAGYLNNAAVTGCIFSGDVSSAGEQLGGIVGQANNCTIDGCAVTNGSTVTGDNYYVGGIAGECLGNCTVSNCEVQAHVICWYPCAGGIVAWLQSGTISNCVVGSNALVRTGQDKAGGIVAYIYHKNTAQTVNIDNCAVYCNVAASYSVGGIVGECNPTHDATVVNISNCCYYGGEIINAGYAASKWTMVGGLVAWARMGTTSAKLNIVNCFSDPAVIRCDFPQALEVDMGGLIGEQGGSNATVNIEGCYNTMGKGTAVINGETQFASSYYQYGALVGNPTKTNLNCVFYVNDFAPLGKANSGTSNECVGMSLYQMSSGELLSKLNSFVSAYSGPLTLRKWVAASNGYPILEGMIINPSTGKKKPLRVSLIGDSLSTFDGYAPHGYQGTRAPNGYRCHYPTSDGNVTSAKQTYWYMLTYDYLKNAVWDTNLAFSGTAVTRCTNTSYSDKYWYGQDFCARYIENGGLGSPDIILINGGANDWAHGIYNMLGSQKLVRYPSSTPKRPADDAMNAVYALADACTTLDDAKALPDASFVEAYVKLVRMISIQYPHAKIVVIIHDTLTPDVEEALLHIAAHYDNCKAVDLYAVNGFNDLGWNFEYLQAGYQPNMPKHDFDWSKKITSGDLRQNSSDHYSAVAMRFIADKIYSECGSWLESSWNDSGAGSISDFVNNNGAW